MDDTDVSGQAAAGGRARGDDAKASAKAEASARMWKKLLTLDEELFQQRSIRLLTPEARVLAHLKLSGPTSVTTAMQAAGVSYRGFYTILERLRQAGIIATVKDEQDQRVRRLSIDPSAPSLP